MARFAPVVPLSIADLLHDVAALGTYHLLLAHDVMESSWHRQMYKYLYYDSMLSDPSYDANKRCVIMDNSLVELKQALPFETVRQAAVQVRANYMVAGDAFLDATATIHATQLYVDATAAAITAGKTVPPLMGVVQGSTVAECERCITYFALQPHIEAIAVPRCLTAALGSRMLVVDLIADEWPGRFKCIHLLGFSDNLTDDFLSANRREVDGIDSAAPIRGALQGKSMTIPYDFGPRGNFWLTTREQAQPHVAQMLANLNYVRRAVA